MKRKATERKRKRKKTKEESEDDGRGGGGGRPVDRSKFRAGEENKNKNKDKAIVTENKNKNKDKAIVTHHASPLLRSGSADFPSCPTNSAEAPRKRSVSRAEAEYAQQTLSARTCHDIDTQTSHSARGKVARHSVYAYYIIYIYN